VAGRFVAVGEQDLWVVWGLGRPRHRDFTEGRVDDPTATEIARRHDPVWGDSQGPLHWVAVVEVPRDEIRLVVLGEAAAFGYAEFQGARAGRAEAAPPASRRSLRPA
jgi:hypothetical protein